MRALCAVGARPNFVKIAPLLDACEAVGLDTVLVHTGQHYDDALDRSMFADLGLRAPDWNLGVGSGTHAEQTARIMLAFEPVLLEVRPDVVIVVGDANSTLACALVAAKCGVLVAHVEAGLRCGDWSMPEEINRVLTDRLSQILLAPSADALAHLAVEGIDPATVHLVGNVMIDSLLEHLDAACERPLLAALGVEPRSYGVVTLHRPANVDDDQALRELLGVLGDVARELPLVLPVHPRARAAIERLGAPSGVQVIEPLGYLDFLCLEASAAVVLTDSGGVQEETTVLGVPCLTLRDRTERPITVTEGTNRVVGRDGAAILAGVRAALATGAVPTRPALWDGAAAQRAAAVLVRVLDPMRRA